MKRSIATALLLGYVLLVPFCFFGDAFATHTFGMTTHNDSAHLMHGCVFALSECATGGASGAMDSAAHHVGMYNLITQTPLAVQSVLLMLIVAFSFALMWLVQVRLDMQVSETALRVRIRGRGERPNTIVRNLLTWLALFEASPNIA